MDGSVKYCRFCGTQLTMDAIFCSECGMRLDASGQSPQTRQASNLQPPNQQLNQQQPAQPSYQQPNQQQPAQPSYQKLNQQQPYQQQPAQQPYQQQSAQQVYQQPAQPSYQQLNQQQPYQQQPYQQTNPQLYQQPRDQPGNAGPYNTYPKRKSSSGGKIAVVIIIILALAGGYYGYNKFLKGKLPGTLNTSVSGSEQTAAAGQNGPNNNNGPAKEDIAGIMALKPEGLIGTWEGNITFKKIQGLDDDPEMTDDIRKQMNAMIDKPIKLVFYFKKDETAGFVGEGTITHPEMGVDKIDAMPYLAAAGKFTMSIQENDANVAFNGDIGKQDGVLSIKGPFKIAAPGGGKQIIEGVWEIKQVSSSVPAG